jgi:hypothetical protein
MPPVTIAVRIPSEVYEKWTRRRDDTELSLEEVIVRFLSNYHFPMREAGVLREADNAQPAARAPQPTAPKPAYGSGWGMACSRRWNDVPPAQRAVAGSEEKDGR